MGLVTWIKGSYLFTHMEVGKYTRRRKRSDKTTAMSEWCTDSIYSKPSYASSTVNHSKVKGNLNSKYKKCTWPQF